MRNSQRLGAGTAAASVLVALALVGPLASNAHAGYNVNANPAVAGSGAAFTYTYNVSVTDNNEVVGPNDSFRVVDFAGYTGTGNVIPAGFAVSTEALTTPPAGLALLHTDEATVANLVVTNVSGGNLSLSGAGKNFTFGSNVGPDSMLVRDFIGISTDTSAKPPAGPVVETRKDIVVPSGPSNIVPEPSSLISLSFGAILLGTICGCHGRRTIRRARS